MGVCENRSSENEAISYYKRLSFPGKLALVSFQQKIQGNLLQQTAEEILYNCHRNYAV